MPWIGGGGWGVGGRATLECPGKFFAGYALLASSPLLSILLPDIDPILVTWPRPKRDGSRLMNIKTTARNTVTTLLPRIFPLQLARLLLTPPPPPVRFRAYAEKKVPIKMQSRTCWLFQHKPHTINTCLFECRYT